MGRYKLSELICLTTSVIICSLLVADAGVLVLLCTILCHGDLFFAGVWLSINARLGADFCRSSWPGDTASICHFLCCF